MKVLFVVYDNASYTHWFPHGMAYLAAVLRKNGHDVSIYNQDIHHYPESHLTEFLDENAFDVVGVGIISGYYQYRKLLAISDAVNNSKNRPFFIIGGHGPSPEPEYFLRKTLADVACIGEAEETIVELLDAVNCHSPLKDIAGIAYREGSVIAVNPRRPPVQDIDTIPFPAYDLFPMEHYRLIRFVHASDSDFVFPVLSGRGCKFRCSFCYRLEDGFRARKSEAIIEEVMLLKKDYRISYVYFFDELLMSSRERTVELCEAFIKADLGVRWSCNGRLNFAEPETLNLMKRAGCVFINYGIESVDDAVLKNMNKALTAKIIERGIKATLEAGISPGFNMIFGNIGDTKETLNKAVDFLLTYDDSAQLRTIRPVTPYPGSPLYYDAVKKGLLKDVEDFYENKHLNSDLLAVNFTEMSDDEFHSALMEANLRLLDNYYNRKHSVMVEQTRQLYLQKNVNFRGYR
jgi:anaerobic magnesium-protoporphyrin IX monomethyl ester cyclase